VDEFVVTSYWNQPWCMDEYFRLPPWRHQGPANGQYYQIYWLDHLFFSTSFQNKIRDWYLLSKRMNYLWCGFSHSLLTGREKRRQTTVVQPVSKIPALHLTQRLMSMKSTVFWDLTPSRTAAAPSLSDQVSQHEAIADWSFLAICLACQWTSANILECSIRR
jgi:hypothetical protein